jgi:Uma2 family endonuclease
MSGVTKEHDRIAVDVLVSPTLQLRDGRCDTFSSDIRVKNLVSGRYTYPDVLVVCGEPQFEDDELDTLLNPALVVEVLSPSTEAYDRGNKFAAYRQLASLQAYVLIAQDRPSVEHYQRQGEQWLLTAVTDLDGGVPLPEIGCELSLREVYRRVRFPTPPSP